MLKLRLSDNFIIKSMEKRISELEISLGQKDSYILELESLLKNKDQPASTRIANTDYCRFKELQEEEYISEILERNKKLKDKIKERERMLKFLENEFDILLNKQKGCAT